MGTYRFENGKREWYTIREDYLKEEVKNMKLSKLLHITSVLTGLTGVTIFATTLLEGSTKLVIGIIKIDVLLCIVILFLIAIWTQIGAIHHMMLEKQGKII